MPILKGIKIDEFENVTIVVFKGLSMRSKKIDGAVHVAVSEYEKSKSEEALVINEETSFAKSDKCHNIDMILDFPNEKSIDWLISYLQELKQEHYNDNGN